MTLCERLKSDLWSQLMGSSIGSEVEEARLSADAVSRLFFKSLIYFQAGHL